MGILQERVYRKSVKVEDELKLRLKLGQASIKASLISQLINGEFVLMHVSTTKESTLNTCHDVLLHNYQQLSVIDLHQLL